MDDRDLGLLAAELTRRLVAAERPLLEAHGLSMWGYVALATLAREPAGTQSELADAMRYDKTRLIAVLDDLEARSLIVRQPGTADRRAHTVRLTAAGRRLRDAAGRDIRAMERDVLAPLTDEDQQVLRRALERLTRPADD